MERSEQIKVLQNTFSNVKDKSPILLVGGAMILFKRMSNKMIYSLKNTADVRDFISQFSGIRFNKPVIVEDIGRLDEKASFLLLKLVEEAKFPIILLSYKDNISAILQSRVKTYIKFPIDSNTKCDFFPISTAQEDLCDERGNLIVDEDALVSYCAEKCPSFYGLHIKTKMLKNRSKFFDLLKGD